MMGAIQPSPRGRVAAATEVRHYRWEACTDRFLEGLAADAPVEISRRAEAA